MHVKKFKNLSLGRIVLIISISAFLILASNASAEELCKKISINGDVYCATGYYVSYNSELDGTQTVTKTISATTYTLKASFLFGGYGAAMQGTGRTGPGGDYIKYGGGGGGWVHINNPKEFTKDVKSRYTKLGITDFTGFGNLALSYPDKAKYSRVSSVTGSSGRTLMPWYSIAVDPSVINLGAKGTLGATGTLLFDSDKTTPDGNVQMNFRADDTGGKIKGKRIDIYLGEGKSALNEWYRTGGDRYVTPIGVQYQAHFANTGWMKSWSQNGETAGTPGGNQMEAIKIKTISYGITYRAHVAYDGWQGWFSNGAVAGTTGKGKSLQAIEIKLQNAPSNLHVYYRVYVRGQGWQGWVSDGATAGTTGLGLPVEAIEIKIQS